MYFRVATNAKHCYVRLITEHNVYIQICVYSDYSGIHPATSSKIHKLNFISHTS